MTAYSVSTPVTNNAISRSVLPGDTVNVSIPTTPQGQDWGLSGVSNCSVSATSGSPGSGIAFTISSVSGNSYSVTVSTLISKSETATTVISGVIVRPPTSIAVGTSTSETSGYSGSITASGGSGTITVSSSATGTFYNNGYPFPVTRGLSQTFYAKASSGGISSSTFSGSVSPLFLSTTTSGGASGSNITYAATTASTIFSSVAANHAVQARTGSTVVASRAESSPNGTASISSANLPAQSTTSSTAVTYSVYVQRSTAKGGDNTFKATGSSFTITRAQGATAPSVTIPTAIGFADSGAESDTASITVTSTGGTGTPYVRSTAGDTAWYTSPKAYSRTRGQTHSWQSKNIGGGISSSVFGPASYAVPYLPTTAAGTLTTPTTSLTATESGNVTLSVASVPSTHNYYIDAGVANDLDITVPPAQATAQNYTYTLYVRRDVSYGGSGFDSGQRNSVIIQRAATSSTAPTSPTAINVATSNALTNQYNTAVSASGGAGGVVQVSIDESNWFSSGVLFSVTRGTLKRFYARRFNSTTSEASATIYVDNTPAYVSNSYADLSLTSATPSSTTLGESDTSDVTVNVVGDSSTTQYRLLNTSSNNRWVSTYNGGLNNTVDFTILYSDNGYAELPPLGTTHSYLVQGRLRPPSGGDPDADFTNTNITFTISRGGTAGVSPPTAMVLDTSTVMTATYNGGITASGGSGTATVSSSATGPFVTNGSDFTVTRGITLNYYAKNTDNGAESSVAGPFEIAPLYLPTSYADSAVSGGANQSVTTNISSGTISFGAGNVSTYYGLIKSNTNTWGDASGPLLSGQVAFNPVGGVTSPSFPAAVTASTGIVAGTWPAAGETYYYRLRTRLRSSYGGSGSAVDNVWATNGGHITEITRASDTGNITAIIGDLPTQDSNGDYIVPYRQTHTFSDESIQGDYGPITSSSFGTVLSNSNLITGYFPTSYTPRTTFDNTPFPVPFNSFRSHTVRLTVSDGNATDIDEVAIKYKGFEPDHLVTVHLDPTQPVSYTAPNMKVGETLGINTAFYPWTPDSTTFTILNAGGTIDVPANSTNGTYLYRVYTATAVKPDGHQLKMVIAKTGEFPITRYVRITQTAATSDPNPNAFQFNDESSAIAGAEVTSNTVTLGGMNEATTVTARSAGLSFSINSGAFTNTVGTTVPALADIRVKATASSTNSTTDDYTITVGTTESATWSITTEPQQAVGPGGSSPTGTSDYGLQVFNADGDLTFGPDYRTSTFLRSGTANLAVDASFAITNVEGMSQGAEIGVFVAGAKNITVTRSTSTSTINLRNDGEAQVSITWFLYRY